MEKLWGQEKTITLLEMAGKIIGSFTRTQNPIPSYWEGEDEIQRKGVITLTTG